MLMYAALSNSGQDFFMERPLFLFNWALNRDETSYSLIVLGWKGWGEGEVLAASCQARAVHTFLAGEAA